MQSVSWLWPAQVRVAAPPRLCHIGRHRGVLAQVFNVENAPESLILPRLAGDIAGLLPPIAAQPSAPSARAVQAASA